MSLESSTLKVLIIFIPFNDVIKNLNDPLLPAKCNMPVDVNYSVSETQD